MSKRVRNPLDGVELVYDVVGEGPELLLLHGSALSGAIWRGLGYTRAFRDQYRVITMDLRGHGRSGKPGTFDAYAMDLLVADVLAVLDAAAAPRAHVGGYSLGGRVGFSLALGHPERVRSLTTLGGSYRIQPGTVGQLFSPDFDAALATAGMPGFVAAWEAHSGRPLDPQTRAAMLANDPAALRAYFRRTETDPGLSDPQLAALTLPALLLAGTRDPLRLTDSTHAAATMPHATVVPLPGRTHGMTLAPSGPVLEHWLPFLAGAAKSGRTG